MCTIKRSTPLLKVAVFALLWLGLSANANAACNASIFNISAVPTLTAGTAQTMTVTAFQTGCGIATGYKGNKNIKLWAQYVNPSTGTLKASINGTAIGTTSATATTQVINFTNGVASVTFLYRDAGSLIMNFQDAGGSHTPGASNTFVVKPAQFVVTVTGNPAAISATGAVFVKAGASFTASVQAKDSAANNTPNYGNETSPASVTLASTTVVLPVGGRNGSANTGAITNGSNFTKIGGGLFSASNLSFDEVGIFKFTASVKGGDYLGGGDVSGPETGNVGRFYPNHFVVSGNTPAFNAGCISGLFTYMDKPFLYATKPSVTVTAKALAGTTTQNYTGSFWRLLSTSLNPS